MDRSLFTPEDTQPRFFQWQGEDEGRGMLIAALPMASLTEVVILTNVQDDEMDGKGLSRLLEAGRGLLPSVVAGNRPIFIHHAGEGRNAPVSAVDASFSDGRWHVLTIRHPRLAEEEWVLEQIAMSGCLPARGEPNWLQGLVDGILRRR